MEEQPVLTQGSIVAAISAVLMALVALGILNLTDVQMQAIVAAVGAVLVVGAPIVGALWARNRTTPTVRPVDVDDTPLVRADNQQPTARAAAAGRSVVKATARGGQPGPTTHTVSWNK